MSAPPSITPTQSSVELLWAADHCSQNAGITIGTVGDGSSVLSMTVSETMLNGLGMCHGGMLFLLADTALAFAAAGGDFAHVSTWGTINFVSPCRLGDVLSASCERISIHGRQSIYDVTLRDQNDVLVALFRGQAQQARRATGEEAS